MLHPRKKSPLFVVPGTYYCCSIIRTAVRTEKQARGYKNIIPGGKTVFHPRKNFHTYANPQMETRRKTPGRNSLRKLWKPLPLRGYLLLYLLNLLQYARTVVPGTYYCCIIPTEKKYPGMRRKYPGEDNNAPSPDKTHSIPNGNPKTRARKSAGRQTSPENPAFPGIPFFPGGRASHPREGAFPSPPRAELDCDACFFT